MSPSLLIKLIYQNYHAQNVPFHQFLTLASKLEKSANCPPLANGSLPNASGCGDFLKLGGCEGLGGAGLGGGCFFFGGNAGLGLVGRGGAEPSLVGACKMANGSQPNGSLSVCKLRN